MLSRYLDKIGQPELTGRDLRRSFTNLLMNEVKAGHEARERYLGHTLPGVTYRHYGEKDVETMQKEVVAPLNRWMASTREGRAIWKIYKPNKAKVIAI